MLAYRHNDPKKGAFIDTELRKNPRLSLWKQERTIFI